MLAACSEMNVGDAGKSSFVGVIEELNGQIAIVRAEEGDAMNSGEVAVNLAANKGGKLEIGDRVEVVFDGDIMESYPLQIKTLSVKRLED